MLLIVDYQDKATARLTIDDAFSDGEDLVRLAHRLHEMIPGAARVRWLYPGGSVDTTSQALTDIADGLLAHQEAEPPDEDEPGDE